MQTIYPLVVFVEICACIMESLKCCLISDVVEDKSMQEILLRATHESQSLIVECLNGYNYGQTFLALSAHLRKVEETKGMLEEIREEANEVGEIVIVAFHYLSR